MYVHRSNRTELLLDALVRLVADPLPDPFASECIVVQGPGIERWLSLELANALSIWANPAFVFPRALLERVLGAVLGEVEDPGIDFEPETLMWSIAEVLPELLERETFTPIRRYLIREGEGLEAGALIALSQRIAETFDHYVIYRPEAVLAWEDGNAPLAARRLGLSQGRGEQGDAAAAAWQAELWRALVARHGHTHLAARMRALAAVQTWPEAALAALPSRISLFGISTLPPLYLEGFRALSERIDVHLFLPSPSREYWAEIRSEREVLRRARHRRDPGSAGASVVDSSEREHWSEGHALLASLGHLGRDFQRVLEEAVDYREDGRDLYLDPSADPHPGGGKRRSATLLETVQGDILALRRRGSMPAAEGGEELVPPLLLAPEDDSIRLHACHGPMREAQVLCDQLLDLFERDSSLEPRDVIVMMPDVEAYAPYLEAVFGGAGASAAAGGQAGKHGAPPRIPARVADRSARAAFRVVEAFDQLIVRATGRMTASDLLDLLGHECIRARFGIAGEALPRLQRWVSEAGIRWGVDALHREQEGQPPATENTWRFGLERLLLGRAMEGQGRRHFAGRVPYDDVEGVEVALLGRLLDFCESLFALRESLSRPQHLSDWRRILTGALDSMIATSGETEHEHQAIREALGELEDRARRAGHTAAVELRSLREQLMRAFRRRTHAAGFLSGGVTFCEMVPMRSIPFRVVCLMGMSDDGFPRIRQPLGFDLIARHPRPGDRSARDDDRYLFLEALLSARDHLLITYVGQSIRDNEPLPPSVVVGELLDHLADVVRLPAAEQSEEPGDADARERSRQQVRERLVVRHPLQPFSPAYFAGSDEATGLFSYAADHCAGARALVASERARPLFLRSPLSAIPAEERVVEVEALVRFFGHPVRAFLRGRLGLFLDDDSDLPEDREPQALAGLPEWHLADELLEAAMATEGDGLASPASLPLLRARGLLPLGVPGACARDRLVSEIDEMAARARLARAGASREPIAIDGSIAGTRVVGRLDDVFGERQVSAQYVRLGRLHGRELGLWIRHLLLAWAAPERASWESHLIGRPRSGDPGSVVLRPVADAPALLEELIELYWIGQTTPLPFFARSSRHYLETLERKRRGGDESPERAALLDAYYRFNGEYTGHVGTGNDQRPEAEDPYVRVAFANVDPLARAFTPLAPSPEPRADDALAGRLGFCALVDSILAPLLAHREERA